MNQPQRLQALRATTPNGRSPGTRGQATRSKLLEATVALVSETPWRSVKVTDIARRAGTSPATFYQYFENVERAITVLAEEIIEEASALADLADGDWSPEASWETALSVAEGFLTFWEENRAIFRVLEFETEDVDAGLRGLRVRALNSLAISLANAIMLGQSQHAERAMVSEDPMAMAGTLVAMLASVSAHRYGFEFWGIRTASLLDSQARLIHLAVTGRPAPVGVIGRDIAEKKVRPRTSPVLGGQVAAHRRSAP
jgi:AcrR family transcriptional regulator